jgi:WD40 repeat protein
VGRVDDAHFGDVNCVRWNPDENFGDTLVSTSDDGTIKIWRFEYF